MEQKNKKTTTGLLHVYCGDGKGKTTTAVGLIVRAAGAGKKVLFYQFMKNGTSSERKILENIQNITCIGGKENAKFSFQMTEEEKIQEKKENEEMISKLFEEANDYDVLCLDEVLYAIRANLLEEELVIQQLKKRKKELEVILTGRDPSERIMELADYVSEIQKKKHPFEQGIPARFGIEY